MGLNLSRKDKQAAFKTISALSINLSAGWFALVFIAPNFWSLKEFKDLLVLTWNVVFGTIFLLISFKFERQLL